jgi:hypothetical protein
MCENTLGGVHSPSRRQIGALDKFTTRLGSVEPQKLRFFIEFFVAVGRHAPPSE